MVVVMEETLVVHPVEDPLMEVEDLEAKDHLMEEEDVNKSPVKNVQQFRNNSVEMFLPSSAELSTRNSAEMYQDKMSNCAT